MNLQNFPLKIFGFIRGKRLESESGKTFLSDKKHRGCARIDGTKKGCTAIAVQPDALQKGGGRTGFFSAPFIISQDRERP